MSTSVTSLLCYATAVPLHCVEIRCRQVHLSMVPCRRCRRRAERPPPHMAPVHPHAVHSWLLPNVFCSSAASRGRFAVSVKWHVPPPPFRCVQAAAPAAGSLQACLWLSGAGWRTPQRCSARGRAARRTCRRTHSRGRLRRAPRCAHVGDVGFRGCARGRGCTHARGADVGAKML